MSQYRDSAEDHLDDVKSRAREGMSGAREAASDTRDYVSEKFRDARERADHLGHEAHERWDSIRDADYDEVWTDVKDHIRDNPGPALLIAGAVGLAVGVLLAGSSAAVRHRR